MKHFSRIRTIIRIQDRLLLLLGNTPEGRSFIVDSMLRRDLSEATSYWLQLIVSVGIATLGLVVGSTAVVIGAMLVAPLMGPIVGLAMGLATGSPFLVLRSAGRIALSVLVALGGALLITVSLPFHELNTEIAARTSPTVLDLATAVFCALAGVYASLRPSSDTTTTAAGTSISISLVPPLCVSGYGIGTFAWSVAGGAALLFLTNLVAIIVVGTVLFIASGFNRVDILTLERGELEKQDKDAPIARGIARRLERLFESRWGSGLRLLMPFVLLAIVYVPLRSALNEVAWQVRVRAAIRETIAKEPLQVVQSRIRVERHEVETILVILGTTSDAENTRIHIDQKIREIAGISPRVEVLAVPDASSIANLESSLLAPQHVDLVPRVTLPSPEEQLANTKEQVRSAVNNTWPSTTSGTPLTISLDTLTEKTLHLRIVHLGTPLTPDALEIIRNSVGKSVGQEVVIEDAAVPTTPLTRQEGDLQFITRVSAGVRDTISLPTLNVCAVFPTKVDKKTRHASTDTELMSTLKAVLATHPRVSTTSGESWSVRFLNGPCPSSSPRTKETSGTKAQ